MLKYQKSHLHLLRISFVVFGSLYRVFAHSSSLILTSLQSIKCHPTACPCLLLSFIAVLRVVVLSSYKHDSDLKSGSCVQLENTTRRRRTTEDNCWQEERHSKWLGHAHCFRHGESHSKWGRGQRRCLGLSLSSLAFVVSVLLVPFLRKDGQRKGWVDVKSTQWEEISRPTTPLTG